MDDPVGFSQQRATAWNAHDVEAVLRHFHDDVVFTSPVPPRCCRTPPVSSGLLTCTTDPSGRLGIRFPADPPRPEPPPADLMAGLPGLTLRSVWRGRLDILVEAASDTEVRALQPNLTALASVDARGVIVTSRSDTEADIVSRFFAPATGIDEDPATGSAHSTLATWWAPRLHRSELLAEQASERGGWLHLRLEDDHVVVSGHAVTVIAGELTPT